MTTAAAGVGTHGQGRLYAYGRISWSRLVALVGDAQCAWADYAGFHIAAVPAQAPPYTHLWAWNGRWLIRARVDGPDAVVGLLWLDPGDDDQPPAGYLTPPELVRFVTYPAQTWPGTEKRVGPLPPELAGRTVELVQIPGDRPVSFIRLKSRAAGRPG